MKIAVFGGSRGLGAQFVNLSVNAGHDVVLLARGEVDPLAIAGSPEAAKRLTVIRGDAEDPVAVEKTVAGADVVFNSLGGKGKGTPAEVNICSRATKHIIAAQKKLGVSKQIVISSIGVNESWADVPFWLKPILAFTIGPALRDKGIQEQDIRASGLQYIVIRPGYLADGGPTGKYQLAKYGPAVSRGDVADFALKQIAGKSEHWGKPLSIVGR